MPSVAEALLQQDERAQKGLINVTSLAASASIRLRVLFHSTMVTDEPDSSLAGTACS